MKNQTSRAGRPARELRPGERVPMSFRVPPELKRRMDEAARESGRSVAQEIEQRLDKSFERGPLLDEALLLAFDEGLAGILLIVGTVMREAALSRMHQKREDAVGKSWLAEPDAYAAAVKAASVCLAEFKPEGSVGSDPQSTGERFARARIFDVVNQGAPYPVGRRQWIDRTRRLLGPELMAQSKWMRDEAPNDAAIKSARSADAPADGSSS